MASTRIDRDYVDRGPMFDALRGRTWVIEPHAIEVEGQKAKANLLAIPGGYLAGVPLGGKSAGAKVLLCGLHKLPGQDGFAIEVIQPGETGWAALSGVEKG